MFVTVRIGLRLNILFPLRDLISLDYYETLNSGAGYQAEAAAGFYQQITALPGQDGS